MHQRFAILGVFGFAFMALTGCGGTDTVGATVPVTGKIELNGTALATGTVTYLADDTKGNKTQAAIIGPITNGQYTLHTTGTTINKPGAPPGWYKVVVQTSAPPAADAPKGVLPEAVKIDRKYTDAKLTPLAVEVKKDAPAGHYDLKVTK